VSFATAKTESFDETAHFDWSRYYEFIAHYRPKLITEFHCAYVH